MKKLLTAAAVIVGFSASLAHAGCNEGPLKGKWDITYGTSDIAATQCDIRLKSGELTGKCRVALLTGNFGEWADILFPEINVDKKCVITGRFAVPPVTNSITTNVTISSARMHKDGKAFHGIVVVQETDGEDAGGTFKTTQIAGVKY